MDGPTIYKIKRIQAGYTQEIAAEHLGISPRSLQYIEAGKREPKISKVFEMADLYGCDISDFRPAKKIEEE